MATLNVKDVIKNSNIPPRLFRAVLRQLGPDWRQNLADIAAHSIDGGFSGFIYYAETVAFWNRNRAEILDLVRELAFALGENPVSMISGFGCLGGGRGGDPLEWTEDVGRVIYGARAVKMDDDGGVSVANALAWFAGEEVARAWADALYDLQHPYIPQPERLGYDEIEAAWRGTDNAGRLAFCRKYGADESLACFIRDVPAPVIGGMVMAGHCRLED